MKAFARTHLTVEALEDRAVPAVMASVIHGDLVVLGDPKAASHLSITASDTNADKVADTFKVMDGTATVGTFSGVTHDLILRLGKEDDAVTIDLAGLSTPHGIRANLGGGDNSLSILNGTVKGAVLVRGGADGNVVTLGGATALTVNGGVFAHFAGPGNGVLELKGSALVKGNVVTDDVASVKLDAGSAVGKNVIDHGGAAADTLSVTGAVGGDVVFFGGKGADTLNVTGTVGGSVIAFLGAGNDVAKVGGAVAGGVFLDGGPGNDTLTLSGAVAGRTAVFGGKGNDVVTVAATARLNKAAGIVLGKGDDTFTLSGAAVFRNLFAQGGRGGNTFVGNRAQAGLKLVGF
jgi:hypothetical protein